MVIYHKDTKQDNNNILQQYRKKSIVYTIKSVDDIKENMLLKPLGKSVTIYAKVSTDETLDDILFFEKSLSEVMQKYVTFALFLENRLYSRVSKTKKKSAYEDFRDSLLSLNKDLKVRFIYALYKRVGDLNKAKELIAEDKITTIAQLNKVIPEDTNVYPSDIIEPLLDYSAIYPVNKKHYWKLVNGFIYNLDKYVAYYAVRNYLRTLYELKIKSLENKKIDEIKGRKVKDIRVNEVFYFLNLIEEASYKEINIMFSKFWEFYEERRSNVLF